MSGPIEQALPLEVRRKGLSARLAWLTGRGALHVTLIFLAIVWLLPSLGLAITSIRPRDDILSTGWWTWFVQPRITFENYQAVFSGAGIGQSLLNSLYITVPATILPVVIGALAAYGFAWLRFPFRDTIFLVIVGMMVVPIQAALVPTLQIFNTLGLTSGYVGIWLAHTAFGLPFAIFLLRNFFVQLPPDLIEAAQMDGASSLGIFRRIVVPLSVPAIASLVVFQFLGVWNDLLMALVFVQNPSQLPLTVQITSLLGTYASEFSLLSAASFVLMFVPLIVFLSLQRYFVRGITAGSVK
ncbi:MAG TPA: carbohydrate ABC transporter permease [Candidatus Limnocylindrales bacterium]|nr:carbohydrate ABC transporter permease [Candidatus Limnocylindrales bacterium]